MCVCVFVEKTKGDEWRKKNLRRIRKEWAKYRAVSFHLNKGTNQTKYHFVDAMVCRRRLHRKHRKDTESINYAYFAFMPAPQRKSERGKEKTINNLHNQVSATVSHNIETESRLGIICFSKNFSLDFEPVFFSLTLFSLITLSIFFPNREDDNSSHCSVHCYDPTLCVIATQNFIPLFMTPLFCIRDFFHHLFFIHENCERISHRRYCHQLIDAEVIHTQEKKKNAVKHDKLLRIQYLDQLAFFFGSASCIRSDVTGFLGVLRKKNEEKKEEVERLKNVKEILWERSSLYKMSSS